MADEPYWTYKAATPTLTLEQAKELGAVSATWTESDWHKLTPGMRREIVRSARKRAATV